ncbi:MAG: hypothetical protein JJ975_02500 [Bacteroidia bacterium]|nr:hypothetical protein [Bacteroidia bacterium]
MRFLFICLGLLFSLNLLAQAKFSGRYQGESLGQGYHDKYKVTVDLTLNSTGTYTLFLSLLEYRDSSFHQMHNYLIPDTSEGWFFVKKNHLYLLGKGAKYCPISDDSFSYRFNEPIYISMPDSLRYPKRKMRRVNKRGEVELMQKCYDEEYPYPTYFQPFPIIKNANGSISIPIHINADLWEVVWPDASIVRNVDD